MTASSFEVPFVDEYLCHSIIYEEYKGDYNRALLAVKEKLDHARVNGSAATIADALLAKGIVHILRGEPSAAIACFREIENVISDDLVRNLRATTYCILALYLYLNTFPNGSGAGLGGEIGSRWQDFLFQVNNLSQRLTNLLNMVQDPQIRLETDLVYGMMCNLLPTRSSLDVQDVRTDTAERVVTVALQAPLAFEKKASELATDPKLLAYTYLAIADLLRRAKQYEPAYTYHSKAYKKYSESNDYAGAATSLMLLGDWYAAPNTSPVLWNHSTLEGRWNTQLSWIREQEELDVSKIKLPDAEKAYAEAKRLFAAVGARRGLAAIQLRYGYLSMLKGDFDAAGKYAINAQKEFESTGDNLGYWTARAHHALSQVGANQMPEDLATAKAIGVWGLTGGSFSYALGLGLLFSRAGHRWLLEGNYERAIRSHRMARSLYDALGANINLAMSFADLADIYLALGERKTALTFFESSLDLFEEDIMVRPQTAENTILRVIGLTFDLFQVYLQGMEADGMEHCAFRLKTQIDNLVQRAKYIHDDNSNSISSASKGLDSALSDLLSRTIDSAKFTEIQNQVEIWMLTNQARQTIEQAQTLCPLYRAVRARDSGDYEAAEKFFDEAMAAAKKSSIEQHNFLEAVVLGQQKKYEDAVVAFERHLATTHADDKTHFTSQLMDLMHGRNENNYEAEIQRKHEYENDASFTFMIKLKAYSKAKQYLEELERSAGSDWYKQNGHPWESLADYGEMYEGLDDLESGLDSYQKAIDELESRRYLLRQDQLKKSLAAVKGSQYLYFQAARAALKLYEKARTVGNSGLEKKYFAQAFNNAEHGKARALLDLMAAGTKSIDPIKSSKSGKEKETLNLWQQLCAQSNLWYGMIANERDKKNPDLNLIGYLNEHVKDAEQKLYNLELELSKSEPGFYKAINPSSKVLSLEDAIELVPGGDTALLQYYFVGEDFLAWSITSLGVSEIHRSIIDAKALDRQVRDFRKACEAGNTFETLSEGLGQSLAKVFLIPFTKTIQENSNLILVPFGAANILPFNVLPWEKKPLGASHAICYLPSVSSLQYLRQGKNDIRQKSVLSIGNPSNMALSLSISDYDDYSQSNRTNPSVPLPAAEIEAIFVASLLPDSKALTQASATEEAVRKYATSYQILHFATHGYLSDDVPLLSSVLLAEGQSLSLYELMGLHLDVDLVVLSACNTGLGEITAGDDVLGLAQGLLGAGARSVLVSLWPVNDISTALFMGEFYSHIRLNKSPVFALKAAQEYLYGLSPDAVALEIDKLRNLVTKEMITSMRKQIVDATEVLNHDEKLTTRDAYRKGMNTGHNDDYKLPYYWAPFILVGGGDGHE